MRAIVVVAALGVLAFAQIVGAQGAPVYDQRYAGPMNRYGQPTFSVPPAQTAPADQNQVPMNGVIPLAVQGVQSVGGYLWSYAPAPLRGVESPYKMTPGQGQVIVNFVPGTP
jgi:hypothetical protein